jgi:hypothetical protein
MRKSQISPAIIQNLFESAANAAAKGQAQWFTPEPWARILALPLPGYRPAIADLNCGNGALLKAASRPFTKQLGCDIEPQAGTNFIATDITKFYPLLRAVNWQCDLFVLNPPWDLHWYRDRLKGLDDSECVAVRDAFAAHDGRTTRDTIDSTVATLCLALDRCSDYGEGFLIGNEATLQRLIFNKDAPHRALTQHIWAHLIIKGNICQPSTLNSQRSTNFETGVIYFARAPQSNCHQVCCASFDTAKHACEELLNDRLLRRKGSEAKKYLHTENSAELWQAAAEELLRTATNAKPQYNIWLTTDGLIRTNLSLFDTHSGRVSKADAGQLFALNGRQPIQLVVQRSQRKALEDAIAPGSPWRVDPALQRAVEAAIVEYNRVRAPLCPLPKIQRLGFLDEQDDILCCKTLSAPQSAFVSGKRYAIRSTTVATNRSGTKMNLSGLLDDVEWNGQELAFFVTDESGVERCFMEGRLREENVTINLIRPGATGRKARDIEPDPCAIDFTLQELVEHFVIPEVPDVAALQPKQYAGHIRTLKDIVCQIGHSGTEFKFKQFQLEDYARSALHDGVILGHDTGLGKTIAMFIWPLLKSGYLTGTEPRPGPLRPAKPVLLVVPGDGHDQTDDESNRHFKTKAVRLDSQKTFLKLARPDARTGRFTLEPHYYLTSYTQLTGNGVTPFPPLDRAHPERTMAQLNLKETDAVEWWNNRGKIYQRHYERLSAGAARTVTPDSSFKEIEDAYNEIRRSSNTVVTDLAFESLQVLKQLTPMAGAIPAGRRETTSPPRPATGRRFNPIQVAQSVSRIAGRKGGENEFVEFQNRKTGVRYIAQKSGDGWMVFVNTPGRETIETDNSYPTKDAAVARAEKLANGTAATWEMLSAEQQQYVRSELAITRHREFSSGIGETRNGIKCVYSPSLADLCQDCFSVCVVDEGTKIKGDNTIIGTGVRQINAPFRLVLTATPIKNRFPDVFYLAHYVSGGHEEPTARFPYGNLDKQTFAEEFLVSERNLTKEDDSEVKRRFIKFTPQVCNVHRAWKLLAPIILRRRKDDCGEDIVPKIRHVVRVPMGLSQAAAYQFHLKARYQDVNGRPAIGAKLQALRIAAANPASELLVRPEHDVTPGAPRSRYTYVPKVASTLELIRQVMERGEQCLVFSAFQNGLDVFSARLNEAGVKHLVLDGRLTQKRRGELARLFKQGPPRAVAEDLIPSTFNSQPSTYPVALAGAECMAELHSFHLCNNVILTAYSWAFDKFEQGINRAHRINSPWPVNVWSVICDGSIDRKLEAGIHEKKDAAELVLDGHLLGENPNEVNLAELLHIAQREFADVKTIDEEELQQGWPRLRAALGKAFIKWQMGDGRSQIDPPPTPNSQLLSSNSHPNLPLWRQRFLRRA